MSTHAILPFEGCITRILSVNVGFGPFSGGGGQRNYDMAVSLLRAGEDVHLLITNKFLDHGKPPAGYPFPPERLTVLPLVNQRYDVPLFRSAAIDDAVRYADVIHFLGFLSAMVPAVWASARRHRKPYVVCTGGILPIRGRSLVLKRCFHALWGRRILRGASRLIAITSEEKSVIARWAAAPDRVVVVPNAIEIRSADVVSRSANASSPFLLFLGGFHPTKGADLLVEAFARLSRSTLAGYGLVMAGGYESERHRIESLARHLGVQDRIRFPGFLTGTEKQLAIASASFVVIPSRLDAMTIVVLEAAAAGRPVLITTGCGFPDVAAEGGGFVVDPTIEGLVTGLQSIVNARDRWPEMSEAVNRIAERYSWNAMTTKYQHLFRDVLNENGSARESDS